ncbi:hypothetical protein FE391_26630 [Nonomuraea sp. KC401]|uniref:hypothetical protein n=1 Tax=unclassified Nonomuraea TaxID=2593643 RepID=UPI0010FDF245|nr:MULTISPECIES: hypothetical protein [unclassified Nonomuraea]NBE94964.1 hypothetical protein [Nonomuraea sp. K271]TLF65012.1 hypothetical protein FE391_26630 [Nonomuraea sp. KC401]
MLTHLGAVAEAAGDLEAAMSHHTSALPLLADMDNRIEPARCHAKIGRVAAGLRDFATARKHVAAGLDLCMQTGRRRGIVRLSWRCPRWPWRRTTSRRGPGRGGLSAAEHGMDAERT